MGFGAGLATNVGVNAAIGIAEASQATEYILDKVSDALPAQVASRRNSFQMMQQTLALSYSDDAPQIMATLQSANFASATGIDYAHCQQIGTLPLGSFAVNRADIQSACNSVAAVFNAASAVTSNFRSALYKILLDHLHGIISADFIQPISDSVGQIAWQPFEHLEIARKAAIQKTNEWKDPDDKIVPPPQSPRPEDLDQQIADIQEEKAEAIQAEYEKLTPFGRKEVDAAQKEVAALETAQDKKLLDGKLAKLAEKAQDYIEKYNRYAIKYPLRAKAALIAAAVVAKGLVGVAAAGPAGCVAGVGAGLRAEAMGAVIDAAAGDAIGAIVKSGIDKYSPLLMKLDGTLTQEQAALLGILAVSVTLNARELGSMFKAMNGVSASGLAMAGVGGKGMRVDFGTKTKGDIFAHTADDTLTKPKVGTSQHSSSIDASKKYFKVGIRNDIEFQSAIKQGSVKYEHYAKHHQHSTHGISPAPTRPEEMLRESIRYKGTSPHRVAVDPVHGEIVVFHGSKVGDKWIYHGYKSSWADLDPNAQTVLRKARLVKPSGAIKNRK